MPIDNELRKKTLIGKLDGFIPGKISNKVVVGTLNLMRGANRIVKKDYGTLVENVDIFETQHKPYLTNTFGFIEDQHNYTDMRFGKYTMDYSGCEVIAVYNAINALGEGEPQNLAYYIADFENDGMVLNGKFGTAPKAINDRLNKYGFETCMTLKEEEYNVIAGQSRTLILTFYNDKDRISSQIHTVNISKSDRGYIAHNVFCNGKPHGPFKNIYDLMNAINGGRAMGISLIGIEGVTSLTLK